MYDTYEKGGKRPPNATVRPAHNTHLANSHSSPHYTQFTTTYLATARPTVTILLCYWTSKPLFILAE